MISKLFVCLFVLIFVASFTKAVDPFAVAPLVQTPIAPASICKIEDGHFFVDFGKDAFGWLTLDVDSPVEGREIEIHLGEKTNGKSVDREPGGSIRHVMAKLVLQKGKHSYRVETPADKRNTSGNAVRLPKDIGVVVPFRYAEILNCPVGLDASMVRQVMLHYPFDDAASRFASSDPALDGVWDLCKYSIKATSFAGTFVDGDRERIPYEADAYLNQLSWYCTDGSLALPRHSHEYLLMHPTWPTEWKQFSVLLAYADWMYSGNLDSIRRNYEVLKNEKTLTKYARADGLVDSAKLKDVVDWPPGERDGFVLSPVNAVVNAFHYRTLVLMGQMAGAIGKSEDAKQFENESRQVRASFNEKLRDSESGVYVDGEDVKHSSLHANLFALAFGLVDEADKPKVIAFIKSRGMACSVYPAQFLLEGLFENGEAEYAISLMTSDSERSWRHMLDFGSTITSEAWDIRFKPNMDWNHAWGAAPANIIPRYVLGVRPMEPGFAKALIAPQLGKLAHVEGSVPTIHGPIAVRADAKSLQVDVPPGITAHVVLPETSATQDIGPGKHTWPRFDRS